MKDIFRYTLLADGTSDEVLMAIVEWLIREHLPSTRVIGTFARDFGPIGNELDIRVKAALRNFPCDLLIVHRDAEGQSRDDRVGEVARAVMATDVPYVCLIPIKMTEAWLFSDESAIRFASGNASGRHNIGLPKRDKWELLPDPKVTLLEVLCAATGRKGRALDKFNPLKARHLITPRGESFEALRGMKSFDFFENDLLNCLHAMGYVSD